MLLRDVVKREDCSGHLHSGLWSILVTQYVTTREVVKWFGLQWSLW